jgi:hypothetical protein
VILGAVLISTSGSIIAVKNYENNKMYTYSNPYFGLLVLSVLMNAFNIPSIIIFHRAAATHLLQILMTIKFHVLLIMIQTLITMFSVIFPVTRSF